jgi:hypothetical protein
MSKLVTSLVEKQREGISEETKREKMMEKCHRWGAEGEGEETLMYVAKTTKATTISSIRKRKRPTF